MERDIHGALPFSDKILIARKRRILQKPDDEIEQELKEIEQPIRHPIAHGRSFFTSQVTLDRPRQVLVRAIEGPLEHLTNTWTFTPVGGATHVDLIVDFQFKSHLLDHVANGMFHEAATRMMSAFESHVHLLHLMRRRATQHPSS
jgi:ribosome-associated toxin RatA of RatAB toxin-antitoxin module